MGLSHLFRIYLEWTIWGHCELRFIYGKFRSAMLFNLIPSETQWANDILLFTNVKILKQPLLSILCFNMLTSYMMLQPHVTAKAYSWFRFFALLVLAMYKKVVCFCYRILSSCNISGAIPDFFENMEQLKELWDLSIMPLAAVTLSFILFTILANLCSPFKISTWGFWVYLLIIIFFFHCRDLSFNKLTGEIPPSFGRLSRAPNFM